MSETEDSSPREAIAGRDWTKGSTFRNLLSLSWPMMVTEGFFMIGTTTDMIWVGRLGPAAIAGVGIAFMIFMVVMMVKNGLVMGARAMVARYVGAGDVKGANHVAKQAFIISAGYATVTTLIGLFFADTLMGLFELDAEVVQEGMAYMRIMFAGWAVMCFWLVAYSIMQASGDSITPMKITITFKLFHVALCPFLVLGWWVFPRLGVSGAAVSYVISQSLGLVLALWVLFSGRSRLRLTLSGFHLDLSTIWRIVKIGIPASVMGVQMAIANLALMRFLSPFGTLAVAAHTLGQRIEMILVLPCYGLGIGAGVMVGQNLGARQPERAARSGWLAAGFAEAFLSICSLVILLRAESIIGLFSSEPGLITMASTFLRIAAAGYLMIGLSLVLQNALSGAGDTLPVMIFGLVVVWLVQLPLAYFLPRVTDFGVYGVRWAITSGIFVGATAYTTYFWLGRWKRKQV